jgi:FMN-dependent NADH-azoreductase
MSVILQQFTDADKVIIGVPMWNFSFAPIVKAYINNLVIAGKSFKYTAQGPGRRGPLEKCLRKGCYPR